MDELKPVPDFPLSPTYKLADILLRPQRPLEWLVEGCVPKGLLLMLCAQPKAGKSTLARDLCLALATGKPWLDRSAVKLERILYIDEENPLILVHDWFHRLVAGRGLTGYDFNSSIMISHYAFSTLRFMDRKDALAETVAKYDPQFVVVDTLRRYGPTKEGIEKDSSVMAEVLAELRAAIHQKEGTTSFIIHHLPKDRRHQDSPMGAQGIAASVDHWWTLRRRWGGRKERRVDDGRRTLWPHPGRVVGLDLSCSIKPSESPETYKLNGTWYKPKEGEDEE